MSLIEKASKRLEELKRSGVDLTDGLESTARPAAHEPDPTLERPAVRRRAAEDDDLPGLGSARQAPAGLSAAEGRLLIGSPQVTIDLARLAASGHVTPDAPHSPIANEFRAIKRPLIANAQGRSGAGANNANLIMVTSAIEGEGKSFSAINLAMSIAMELDNTVLLVDADVANPSIREVLGLPQRKGLLDVLTEPRLDLADVLLRTNVEKLSILPPGTPHARATELLASEAMTRLVHEMATRYPDRIVVFDSPPLLLTTESRVLATHMGQIVMIVEAERTTAGVLKHALAGIEECPIVVTVLNKARSSEIGQYGYGYRYGP